MKKNRIVLLFLLFLGGWVFNACQREELEAPPEISKTNDVESMLKGITNPEVRKAIEWYGVHWPIASLSRGTTEEHPLFKNMVPDWSYAFVRGKGSKMSVEVPLRAHSRLVFTLPENAIAYDESKNVMYVNSLTRLVVLKDKATGITQGFFMTLIPSKKYMDAKKFNVYRSTYFERERDFDGYIYFHELDGRFANGWRYSDGKITHSVREAEPEAESTSSLSRSGGYWIDVTNCNPVYEQVCDVEYIQTESGQVPVEMNCTMVYKGEKCVTESIWMPDPNPGQGGGDYDPKDKCPYGTSGCPGGSNCTCCKICEGPCIVVPCPGCGTRHCNKIHIDCDKVDDATKAIANELFDDIGSAEIFGNGTMTFKDFLNKVSMQPTREHSITLNKEWDTKQNKQVNTLKDYELGGTEHVTMNYDKLTHAVIHTHPNSTTPGTTTILPPSARDVFNVMDVVIKKEVKSDGTIGYTYSNFKTSYVLADGYTFALTVTDRKKVVSFLQNNPNFVDSDEGFVQGTNVGKAYEDAQGKLTKNYNGVERDAYALAYALQKSDAGVQLLWKKDGETVFTVLKARDVSSDVIYVYYCK